MRYQRVPSKSHLVTFDVARSFIGASEPLHRHEGPTSWRLAMLKLPPPIWALIYVLVLLAMSWQLGWPLLPGFPLPTLGIALALIPWALPVWAAVSFHREGTEISPVSPTNSALIVDGPYR